MKFCAKMHKYGEHKILAICDEEVLNKEFEFKDVKIKVSSSFYFEKIIEEKDIENLLREANIINIFGNRIVEYFIKKGLLKEKNILVIGNQRHAIIQIL
ncbi:MAG: DUF424 family protein [Candidatus Aenigmatarchaeota archaeon]